MMDIRLRLLLIASTFASVLLVIRISKRGKMEINDATNWLLVSAAFLLAAVFPEIIVAFSNAIGIEVASNAAFALVLGLILLMMFYLNIRISKLAAQNKELTQKIALMEKSVRERYSGSSDDESQ